MAFAVFLLPFFVCQQDKPAYAQDVDLCLLIWIFYISKIQIGGKGRGVQSWTGKKEIGRFRGGKKKELSEKRKNLSKSKNRVKEIDSLIQTK